MADPITPNTANVNGQPITLACTFTSGGASTRATFDLEAEYPLIDLRIGHPVLSIMTVTCQGDDGSGSLAFTPANEMARGTVADTDGEWDISDANTVAIRPTADLDGFAIMTYIPFGAKEA